MPLTISPLATSSPVPASTFNRLRLHVPEKSGRNVVSVRRFTGRAGTAAPRDGLAVAWLTPMLKTKDGYLISNSHFAPGASRNSPWASFEG
jgi:hypothetical protein